MPHKAKHRTSQHKEKKTQTPSAAPVSSETKESLPTGVSQVKATLPQTKATSTGYRPGIPRTGRPANTAAIGATRYPYLSNELKWIGIFAVVIIVVLIILAMVLPRFLS